MLERRREAAKQVADRLFEFEEQIDRAMAAGAKLAAELPEARRRANLSAVVGQEAIDLVGEALQALYQVRKKTVDAHHELADVHSKVGLKVYAGGMLWKLADLKAGPELTVVGKKAA